MSFISQADVDMGGATLDFFDRAWNLEQTSIFGFGAYPNFTDLGNLVQNQYSPNMEADDELGDFSFQLQHSSYDTNGGPAATLFPATEETEALPVDLMSFEPVKQRFGVLPPNPFSNGGQTQTALNYEQISSGTLPEENSQIQERSASSSTQEPKRDGITPSSQGTRPLTGKPSVPITTDGSVVKPNRKPYKSKKTPLTKEQEQVKRKQLLERNRKAANKCRNNRKKWTDFLQQKCYEYKTDNNLRKAELQTMEDEVVQIKSMLMMHSECCKDEHIQAWITNELDQSQEHPKGAGKKE